MGQFATLRDAYLHELKDLHSAESQLTKALPKLVRAAESEALRDAFEAHLEETQRHLELVEGLLSAMGETKGREKCKGMEGLIEEGAKLISENEPGPVLDAAIIAAAQRVEHYEIAAYGSARAFAEALGETEAVAVLTEILEQESAADDKLTTLAAGGINEEAVAG